MKKTFFPLLLLIFFSARLNAQKEFYEIRVYELRSAEQEGYLDQFLSQALVPALHRQGITQIGVFKPLGNDTMAIRKIVMITPYSSLDAWHKTSNSIIKDPAFITAGRPFTDADTSHRPYQRMESTLLEAFPDQPKLIPTTLRSNPDAVYELRSYESPTEKLHRLKVSMFNEGGEIKLFKRLDFQALFYADVLSGNRMPNLVYMIAFSSVAAREEHWKAFGASPEWKALTADPHWENNVSVSHIDSWLLKRTSYSDL